MGRLFANNEVQYYGSSHTYEQNQTAGERPSFASYISEAVDGKSMQELSVCVTVEQGEDLTIGVRSGSLKGDGTQPVGANRTGKFRVDYFRIERISADDPDAIRLPLASYETLKPYEAHDTYDLSGRRVPDSHLPKGIYIRNARKIVVR